MTTKQQTAITILDQLTQAPEGQGLALLTAMVGARDVGYAADRVRFKFKGCWKWNGVEITLNERDTYDVQFWKYRSGKVQLGVKIKDVYADNLRAVFEEETGLDVNL